MELRTPNIYDFTTSSIVTIQSGCCIQNNALNDFDPGFRDVIDSDFDFLLWRQNRMYELSELREAIINGDDKLALDITLQALKEQANPVELINEWMIPAMDEVGRRFEAQEFFFPEMLLAARAMKLALEPLRPLLAASGVQPTARVVIGTVKGDLHDIGKNMVAYMLEGAGFEVHDIGIDVPAEKFIEALQTHNADILAISALLTTTMPEMQKILELVDSSGFRGKVKVMVGGAPITQSFANEIGADGYGENAGSAVSVARALAGKS
jgi:5-methyltetrahydrofolate--homocysteine methyltransferase